MMHEAVLYHTVKNIGSEKVLVSYSNSPTFSAIFIISIHSLCKWTSAKLPTVTICHIFSPPKVFTIRYTNTAVYYYCILLYCILLIILGEKLAVSCLYLHSWKPFAVTSFTRFHSIHIQKFAKKLSQLQSNLQKMWKFFTLNNKQYMPHVATTVINMVGSSFIWKTSQVIHMIVCSKDYQIVSHILLNS